VYDSKNLSNGHNHLWKLDNEVHNTGMQIGIHCMLVSTPTTVL